MKGRDVAFLPFSVWRHISDSAKSVWYIFHWHCVNHGRKTSEEQA